MSQSSQKFTFDTFTHWARTQRQIYICDGIAPGMIGEVGDGSGIFARRNIKPCERSGEAYKHTVFFDDSFSVLSSRIFTKGSDPWRLNSGKDDVRARSLGDWNWLLYIPTSALLTTDTVVTACGGFSSNNGNSETQVSNLPPLNCSTHALLAAYLTRTREDPELRSWRATWPQEEDLEILPVKWNEDLRAMLPEESASLVDRQRRRIQDDWNITRHWISSGINESDEAKLKSSFEYHWLIINTRTFYWPQAQKWTKLQEAHNVAIASKNSTRASAECLALCPWADLFNHTDEEFASATFDENGYTVTALRTYNKGEEIFVNYGSHGNDYLLAEYGFILPANTDDSHNLDAIILPDLTTEQEEALKESGYYGKYSLSPQPPHLCFRTHAVLRLLALSGGCCGVKEAYKFQDYYAFIKTAIAGPQCKRRKAAEKALELVLETLNEKCTHTIYELGRYKGEGDEKQRSRFLCFECSMKDQDHDRENVAAPSASAAATNISEISQTDEQPKTAQEEAESVQSKSNPPKDSHDTEDDAVNETGTVMTGAKVDGEGKGKNEAEAVDEQDTAYIHVCNSPDSSTDSTFARERAVLVHKAMLRNRWVQISEMLTAAMAAARREVEINSVGNLVYPDEHTGLF